VNADPAAQAGERRCTATVTMQNAHGLHARPAHLWVQTANSFASRLRVGRPGEEMVDGKSIMGIMMLAAECGTVLEIEAEGPDCDEQIRAIRELVESGFGE
jgi:phosphotransferase system HPr (HPr) family protein